MSDQTPAPASLSSEAADALLAAIRDKAPRATTSEAVHHLADAYAAVRASMPKRSSSTARRVS